MSNWAKLKEKLVIEASSQVVTVKSSKPAGSKVATIPNGAHKGGPGRNGVSKKRKRHELSDAAER